MTAVWREGCVCLAVCCLMVCSGRGHFGVQHFANIGVCISQEVKPSGLVCVYNDDQINKFDLYSTLWTYKCAQCALYTPT